MSDSFIVAASNDDFQLALFLFFFSFLNKIFILLQRHVIEERGEKNREEETKVDNRKKNSSP
jgi:hypothetical protein